MTLAVYWLCFAVLLSCNVLVQSEITTLYPTDPQDWSLFPYGAGDVETEDIDDYFWDVVDIGQNFTFFGTSYDKLRVNTNGYVQMGYQGQAGNGVLRNPFPSASQRPAVAPFNVDIDFDAYRAGFLSYRLDSTAETKSLATDAVMAISQYAQELPDFEATRTFVVTWHDAVFYEAEATDPRVTNTFQLVLVWDDMNTFAIFNYGHQMDWTGPYGDMFTGLGGDPAIVGIDAGDEVNAYMLPGSQTDAIRDIVRNKRVVFKVDAPTYAPPLCFPGSWSASGDALLGPCSECLVGFYQVKNIYFSGNNINDVTGPGSSVLDPHFMITNPKTGERFCFDYGGKERDILNLVHDEKAELSIDGVLFKVGPTVEKVTYFANIIIGTSAGTRLNFTKYEITVGDEELSWDMDYLHVGDDVVIRPLHERAQTMLVELDSGDIGVVVTRHHDDIGYYLGVYLSNTVGLSNDSEGLLGQFIHNDFDVDVPNSLVTWHLSRGDVAVRVEQKTRFSPAEHDNQMCWVYLTEDGNNELFTAAMTHTNTHARTSFIGGV